MMMAKLKDNMVELASEPVPVPGLPDGFKEGPFVFEREGKYYFTFPWVRDKTETLAYGMGDSPMGPFEFKGIIMDESPVDCWTNHHPSWNIGGNGISFTIITIIRRILTRIVPSAWIRSFLMPTVPSAR